MANIRIGSIELVLVINDTQHKALKQTKKRKDKKKKHSERSVTVGLWAN